MVKYKIGCVVMAAGNSKRFGSNKLSAPFLGKTIIEHTLDSIPAELFSTVTVVTQYPEIMALAEKHGFDRIENKYPEYGISHTIKLGTEHMPDCDAIMYLVSDQPLLRKDSIEAVAKSWMENPDKIAAAGSGGVRGNPCIFPREFFTELLKLREDNGGNQVIRMHEDRLLLVDVPSCELTDVDTKKALDELKINN